MSESNLDLFGNPLPDDGLDPPIGAVFPEQNTRRSVSPPIPVLALGSSTGVGKSHIARELIAKHLRQLRADGDNRTVVVFVPTHKLGAEQSEKFRLENPDLIAERYLGIAQEDPRQSGQKMCHRAELVVELCQNGSSMRDLCAKPRLNQYCPYHYTVAEQPCGYSLQGAQHADVWFLPHQMLFAPTPRCVGDVSLVCIDESFWSASLEGFGQPYRFKLNTLIADRGEQGNQFELVELAYISQLVHRGLCDHSDGFIDAHAVTEGLSGAAIKRAYRYEMRRLSAVAVSPDMTSKALKQAEKQLKGISAIRLARFWDLLGAGLLQFGETPHIKKCSVDGAGGTDIWIHLYWHKSIHHSWSVPTMLIDATLSEPLNRLFYPELEFHRFHVPMQHTHVVQVTDKLLSKASILPSTSANDDTNRSRRTNLQRLANLCQVLASRPYQPTIISAREIKVLLITNKAVEERLIEIGLPEGVATLHYGATSGLDAYGDVPCLVIAGRIELPIDIAEHQAAVFNDGAVKLVEQGDSGVGGRWYPRKTLGIETSEDVIPVRATRHPDVLAEAIRSQWNEAQLTQAIGRARAVRRTSERPLDLFVLTNVPLPLVVDQAVEWSEVVPTDVEVMLAKFGVALISYNEMVRVVPLVWNTQKKARTAVSQFINRYPEAATESGCPFPYRYIHIEEKALRSAQSKQLRLYERLIRVEYTRDVKGAKPCCALIRKGHGGESGRAVLESLVGPLKKYRILFALHATVSDSLPKVSEQGTYQLDPESGDWSPGSTGTVCGRTECERVFYRVVMK